MTERGWVGALALLALVAVPTTVRGGDPVQALLDEQQLARAFNPVLLNHLLEGGSPLAEASRKRAVEQLVSGFREQMTLKPGAQVTASVLDVVGLVAGGSVGAGVREGMSEVYEGWLEAASVLAKAGYRAEVVPFYERCLQTFPSTGHRARCAAALVALEPGKAFALLNSFLDGAQPVEVNNVALVLLGDLVATPGVPAEQKDAAFQALVKHTQGLMSATNHEAAVEGLIRSRDPRAVEPLRKMTKGLGKDEAVKRAALRGLAVGFQDAAALEQLQKQLKGGFMKNPADQAAAGLALIEAGHAAGFAWAGTYLGKPKKKGLFSTGDQADFEVEVVQGLMARSGDDARRVLAGAAAARPADDPMGAAMAVAAFEMGEASLAERVRGVLGLSDLDQVRLRAAVALARGGDLAGLPVLETLARARDEATRASAADALGALDRAEVVPLLTALLSDRQEQVRLRAAWALAGLTNGALLDGAPALLAADLGRQDGAPRAPQVQAALLLRALERFPADARTGAVLKQAAASPHASVKFLALIHTPAPAPAATPAPKAASRRR